MTFSLVIVVLLSVVLLFVHIFVQGGLATYALGWRWNIGARDGKGQPLSVQAGRAERASANYRETWPAFLALAFLAGIVGGDTVMAAAGAWVWFIARLVYLPLYLSGIPFLRSMAWLSALSGLGLMAVALLL